MMRNVSRQQVVDGFAYFFLFGLCSMLGGFEFLSFRADLVFYGSGQFSAAVPLEVWPVRFDIELYCIFRYPYDAPATKT